MLFKSKFYPGLVMNKYGVVMEGGSICSPMTRALVRDEAVAAGWHLVPSGNPDVGNIYVPPDAPPDGKGSE